MKRIPRCLGVPFELTMPSRIVGTGGATVAFGAVPKTVILVGAGGTGARVGMLLSRILTRGAIHVVDPDVVESRNLLRQHFHPNDVGKSKALVVAARIKAALPESVGDAVTVIPYQTGVADIGTHIPHIEDSPVIMLGCVDNAAARIKMHEFCRVRGSIYIDAGNDLRFGQVVVSLFGVSMSVNQGFLLSKEKYKNHVAPGINPVIYYDGMTRHAPDLLTPTPTETAPCGLRFDTQTVAANQMAASVMGSVLSGLLDGLPLVSPFYQFSTLPIAVTNTPFDRPSMYRLIRQGSFWSQLETERVLLSRWE